MKNLAKNYKGIVTLEHIGYSFEGRALYVIKISRGGEGKPKILIDAGIHAREWLAPSTALYTIHQLVVNKSNEHLYENVDWHIVPSINPDGYEYSHTSVSYIILLVIIMEQYRTFGSSLISVPTLEENPLYQYKNRMPWC